MEYVECSFPLTLLCTIHPYLLPALFYKKFKKFSDLQNWDKVRTRRSFILQPHHVLTRTLKEAGEVARSTDDPGESLLHYWKSCGVSIIDWPRHG
jgi:hypothetical protein